MTTRGGADIVVVTGAAGALGSAIVRSFVHRGAHVIAVDRSDDAMGALEAHREAADLTDPQAVDGLFERIDTGHGPPDVVVHTVGAFRGGSITESTTEDFRVLLEVNLAAAWWISRAAAAPMKAAGRGAIIHIGARHGVVPTAGAAAYGVTKAALVHLTRVLDVELRPHGVRVNAVLPGLMDTATNRATLAAGTMSHAVAPEAIAGVITFLASDDAAPISGAIIPVYGTG